MSTITRGQQYENKVEKDDQFVKEFVPHHQALYNFAYSMTRDEDHANDLVQETLLKAYRYFNYYQLDTNAKSWLFKILQNIYINEYRKKSKEPHKLDYENANFNKNLGDITYHIFDKGLGDGMTRALSALPVDLRAILIMTYVEGFKYKEIAEMLEIPIGTVKTRLHRARNLMKQHLLKIGYSDN